MQILNDPWPWTGTLRGHPLEVADLIAADTLSPAIAATLAWTIQHGASVFVVAGPPGAGKSTVANALLTYLPDAACVYVTAGGRDHMQVPSDLPGPLYLLINELSAHMPMYLYGPAAQQAFLLLRGGARMFGTLHARSAGEAVRVLSYESDLAPTDIPASFVFVVVQAGWVGQHIVRRVVEVGLLVPGGELTPLTRPATEGAEPDPASLAALAAWAGTPAADVERDIARHAAQLSVARV